MTSSLAEHGVSWLRRRRLRARQPHGIVLMYHRVSSVAFDPWQLAVSPPRFESQLIALQEHFDVVPLASFRASLRAGRASRPVVALTFDDGHVDNLRNAKPLLERYALPATVFITTGWIGRPLGFWWDRLAQLTLPLRSFPDEIAFSCRGERFTWSDPALSEQGARGTRSRRRLHKAVWDRLCAASDRDQDEALDTLAEQVGMAAVPDDTGRPMTESELRKLISSGLVDLGAHSVSHPRLSALSYEEKSREILESQARCASLLGRPPVAFAFPFGDHDAASVQVVRDAAFQLAVTTNEDVCWESSDRMLTPRIAVTGIDGATLLRRLRWLWLP